MKTMFVAAALSVGAMMFAGCAASTPASTTTPKAPQMELPQRIQGGISLASLQDTDVMMLQREQEVLLKVRLCVAPDGSVADAKLVKPSGHESYDNAVISSIKDWKYQPYKAESDMRVCKTVRVQYNAG